MVAVLQASVRLQIRFIHPHEQSLEADRQDLQLENLQRPDGLLLHLVRVSVELMGAVVEDQLVALHTADDLREQLHVEAMDILDHEAVNRQRERQGLALRVVRLLEVQLQILEAQRLEAQRLEVQRLEVQRTSDLALVHGVRQVRRLDPLQVQLAVARGHQVQLGRLQIAAHRREQRVPAALAADLQEPRVLQGDRLRVQAALEAQDLTGQVPQLAQGRLPGDRAVSRVRAVLLGRKVAETSWRW